MTANIGSEKIKKKLKVTRIFKENDVIMAKWLFGFVSSKIYIIGIKAERHTNKLGGGYLKKAFLLPGSAFEFLTLMAIT